MDPLKIPKLTKYINDFSDILTTEQIESLSEPFINHERATTEQIATVFIPHREWNELLDIWLKIFNENGIGQKNLNNGLLLIVATDEKKLRIIVGKWLELKYTEMVCRDIVENHLRPLLNEWKYEELIQRWKEVIKSNKIQSKNIDWKSRIQILLREMFLQLLFVIFIIPVFIWLLMSPMYSIIWIIGIIFIYRGSHWIHQNYAIKKIEEEYLIKLIWFGVLIISWCMLLFPATIDTICSFKEGSNCQKWNSNYHIYTEKWSIIWWAGNLNSNHYNWNSTSDYWSDWDYWSNYDSSSSYDGGGGSSNGGGYGD